MTHQQVSTYVERAELIADSSTWQLVADHRSWSLDMLQWRAHTPDDCVHIDPDWLARGVALFDLLDLLRRDARMLRHDSERPERRTAQRFRGIPMVQPRRGVHRQKGLSSVAAALPAAEHWQEHSP